MIYGASDPKAGACHSLYNITNDARLNHEVTVIRGVLAERCGQLLKDFFRMKREKKQQQRRAPARHRTPAPSAPAAQAAESGTIVKDEVTKLGRNDPCWCGSEKKYKNCHFKSDRASA